MAKRVNLTLPEDDYSVLKLYADALGTTPSTVGRDLLCQLTQSMKSVVEALDSASDDKNKAILMMQSELLKGVSEASGEASKLQKELNL